MKKTKLCLFLFLLCSLVLIFSMGVSAEYSDVPDDIFFYLPDDPDQTPLKVNPEGTTQINASSNRLYRYLGLSSASEIGTVKVFSIEIPKGTTSFAAKVNPDESDQGITNHYSAWWYISNIGTDSQTNATGAWPSDSIVDKILTSFNEECYLILQGNPSAPSEVAYAFYCVEAEDTPIDDGIPSDIFFYLPDDPDQTPLKLNAEGTTQINASSNRLYRYLGLSSASEMGTVKVFSIEIPKGTTSFAAKVNQDESDQIIDNHYGGFWYITNIGTDSQTNATGGWPSDRIINRILTSFNEECYLILHGNPSAPSEIAYAFYCVETGDAPVLDPVLTDFKAGSIANYVGNTSSVTVGATFENVENDTPVKFYVTDKENGTSEDAIAGTLVETTAEKVTPQSAFSDITVPVGRLEAGQFWLAAEVGDSRMYQPFTMYATAREYAEGIRDLMINWYRTIGFYNGETYVGLSADSGNGSGIDWEAYIFGALGYEADDPLLTSADGKTYLDYLAENNTTPTTYPIPNQGAVPAAKPYARMVLGITGIGGDPRHVGVNNMVRDLISIAYEDGDIEGGKLRLDEDGSLHVRVADSDTIAEGYLLLALEVANATPAEGYTEELRQAGLKTMIKTDEAALSGAGGDEFSGFTNGKNISDFYTMTLFAAEFLNDVEGMEGEAKRLLDRFEAYYASVVANPENEMNLNSIAMATTAIVGNGVDFETYTTDPKWQRADGSSELSRLLGPTNARGGLGGFTDNRLSEYENLQALADLLNGKTCFRLAHEKYSETYPQYTDAGQEVANQLKALPEEITDAEDIEAVNEAREAYEDFMAGLSEKADVESVESYYADLEAALGEAEEACVEYVEEAIAAIGEVTLDDADAIAAAREAFDALTDEQKELVANEDDLTAAEEALAAAIVAADEAAAKAVDDAIAAIGEVTLDDAEAIAAARAAYDALTDKQKALVKNEEVLKEAEAVLAELVKEAANPFEDVKSGDYFFDAVLWAVENDITKGTDKTHFSPANKCSRGQIVTFLWRAAGEPDVAAKNPFGDVKEGSYYYEAVLWAVEKGITTGTGKTTFSPDASCTRSQIVTFLWRAAGSPEVGGDNPFNDVKADAYYYNAVLWAVDQGITTGATPKTFAPDKVCSRGEAVTFLFRAQ